MGQAFVAADFYHTPFRCDVAMQDDEATGFFERLIEGRDDGLARRFLRGTGFFGKSFSGHGHGRTLRKLSVEQALGDDGNASGFVDVGGDVFSCGLQVR